MSETTTNDEIEKAYQDLGTEFGQISSYEKLAKFYSSLGNFSMMLDPDNQYHQNGYVQILNQVTNKFSSFPEFKEQTYACFSKLPEEQKLRYMQLSGGNAWQMMSQDDYMRTRIKAMAKGANNYIASLPAGMQKPKEMLGGEQFLDMLEHFTGKGTAEMTRFATHPENQAFADDFRSGHPWIKDPSSSRWGLSERLQRTKDIIATTMHAEGLEAVLKTGDFEKISNYFLEGGYHRANSATIYDGEGVSAYKKEISLMEQYLDTAARQPDIASSLKLSQELEKMIGSAEKAMSKTDSIYYAGKTLDRLLSSFKDIKSISPEEFEQTLSMALNGKDVKGFSLQAATSPVEYEKIEALNLRISILKDDESLKQTLKPYDGALLNPMNYADLEQKYHAARQDYEQKIWLVKPLDNSILKT